MTGIPAPNGAGCPILITGASGQVGGAVAALLSRRGHSILAPSRAELDLRDHAALRSYIRHARPAWIISSAASTAVDAAESDRDDAFAANAIAPGILAEEAKTLGAGLIHLSTDYVFDGSGTTPWRETDPTGPLNVYGASKLAGEQAVAAADLPHVILRTSWVYSVTGKNFVRTLVRLLTTRTEPLTVVADQHGAPTAAHDLAHVIAEILAWADFLPQNLQDVSGLYHCAAQGETTWAGLANTVRDFLIAEQRLQPVAILPVPTSAYPTPAARPLNSRLDCTKLSATFRVHTPEWQSSVWTVCRQLAASGLHAH